MPYHSRLSATLKAAQISSRMEKQDGKIIKKPKRIDPHIKEFARLIYLREDITQKDLSIRVGVNEKTIKRWIDDGKWDAMRKTLLTTKQEQLNMLYDILDKLTREGKAALEDDDPDTNPNADAIIKITNAIKKLETQTGAGEIIDALTRLIKFIQAEDLALAKTVTHWADLFIQSVLKS